MDIIVSAKDRQAAEANKNANILLQEIDRERELDEQKKQVAAKRRERRKERKKKGKQDKKDGKEWVLFSCCKVSWLSDWLRIDELLIGIDGFRGLCFSFA